MTYLLGLVGALVGVVDDVFVLVLLDEPDFLSFLAIAAAAVRCPNSALSAGCEWALARTVLVAVQVMRTAAAEAIIRRMVILLITRRHVPLHWYTNRVSKRACPDGSSGRRSTIMRWWGTRLQERDGPTAVSLPAHSSPPGSARFIEAARPAPRVEPLLSLGATRACDDQAAP